MKQILHITSGDIAGDRLAKSGLPGEVFVWHDILYDGPRKPGWPDDMTLDARADFIENATGGGLGRQYVLETLKTQYAKLKRVSGDSTLILWFDACLFDQSMLCHILACMRSLSNETADLFCIDAFPGIDPYHGIGQLSPTQLAAVYDRGPSLKLKREHFLFAEHVDRAFALQDLSGFQKLADQTDAPLPWIPAAAKRWMAEFPDEASGLGRLEQMALAAVKSGCETPAEIFSFVSERETPPQYWGDITLWEKLNALADREAPLVKIKGPDIRLPQWEGIADLKLFRVYPANGQEPGERQPF